MKILAIKEDRGRTIGILEILESDQNKNSIVTNREERLFSICLSKTLIQYFITNFLFLFLFFVQNTYRHEEIHSLLLRVYIILVSEYGKSYGNTYVLIRYLLQTHGTIISRLMMIPFRTATAVPVVFLINIHTCLIRNFLHTLIQIPSTNQLQP